MNTATRGLTQNLNRQERADMNGTESDAISSKSRLHPESTLRRIGNLTSEERTLLLGYLWAQIDQDVLVRALDRMDEKLKP